VTPEEQRRLAVVETRAETMAADIHEMKVDLKRIADILAQAKGSWRTLVVIGAISGAVGAFIGKFAPFLPFGK